ncbi:transposase [Nannocystaceae bacterium ST9]
MTRRCSERRFFLRPDPTTRQIFEYVLALACTQHEMQLHAFVMMSNHYHLVVTDPHGHISDFEQQFNSLVARALNQYLGRDGSLWDPDSFNGVELLDEEAVVERLAYVHANPVTAHLVKRALHWDATSAGLAFGERRSVERPRVFFSESMPQQTTLELVRPRVFMHLNDEALARSIRERVIQAENQSVTDGAVLGMRRVLAQHWNDSPPRKPREHHIRPRVAAACAKTRALALQAYRAWLESYADAIRRFCEGQRDVMFPLGTYWMTVRLGCPGMPP